jgi:hypothetical protein
LHRKGPRPRQAPSGPLQAANNNLPPSLTLPRKPSQRLVPGASGTTGMAGIGPGTGLGIIGVTRFALTTIERAIEPRTVDLSPWAFRQLLPVFEVSGARTGTWWEWISTTAPWLVDPGNRALRDRHGRSLPVRLLPPVWRHATTAAPSPRWRSTSRTTRWSTEARRPIAQRPSSLGRSFHRELDDR